MWKESKQLQSSFLQLEYPNAKTIRLKRDALSVCIIYQAKPKLTLILCKFTYTLLVSWHTVISRNNIPTLNESLQTSTLEKCHKSSIL